MTRPPTRVVREFRDLKGRYTVSIEREDGARCLGHSWSSYEQARHDAEVYLEENAPVSELGS